MSTTQGLPGLTAAIRHLVGPGLVAATLAVIDLSAASADPVADNRVVRTALGEPIVWPRGAQVVISDEAPDWVETAARDALAITRQVLDPGILDGALVALPSVEPIVQPYPMAFIEYVEGEGPVKPASLDEPSPREFVVESSRAQAGDRELGTGDYALPFVSTFIAPSSPTGPALPCVITVFSVGDILAYAHIRIGPIEDTKGRSACVLAMILAASGLEAGTDLAWNPNVLRVMAADADTVTTPDLADDPAMAAAIDEIRAAYEN